MTQYKAIDYVFVGWAFPIGQKVELYIRVRYRMPLTPKTQGRTITVKEVIKVFRKRGYIIDEVQAFGLEQTISYLPMEKTT